MATGYSGTPLVKKLGIKPGYKTTFIDLPEDVLEVIYPDIPPDAEIIEDIVPGEMDFIHFFNLSQAALREAFPTLKAGLKKNGTLWISWAKKSAKMETDLNGNIVREIGLKGGLVDVKICSVSEIWSGMKFMYRRVDR